MIERMIRLAMVGAVALTLSATAALPASARDGDVIRRGACSGASDWKLKLSPENGKIEVEYEVDSNRVGQTWKVRLFHGDDRVFAGQRETKGTSGSFTVRIVEPNRAGTDSFHARATNLASGEVCGGRASIG
jgi:hypothetical protein